MKVSELLQTAVNHTGVKTTLDISSVVALAGAWSGILTPVATLLTILWMGIRIWETDTFKSLRQKLKRDDVA